VGEKDESSHGVGVTVGVVVEVRVWVDVGISVAVEDGFIVGVTVGVSVSVGNWLLGGCVTLHPLKNAIKLVAIMIPVIIFISKIIPKIIQF